MLLSSNMNEGRFRGSEGEIVFSRWDATTAPRGIFVFVHGYAEHGRRYARAADALVADGFTVFAPDHIGHGKSDGERALITDFEHVVDDLHALVGLARTPNPALPVVMAGHSMGGLLTARFVQRYPDLLAGAAFLGAVLGDWAWAREVLALPEIPFQEPEYSGMSRDPEAVAGYAEDPLVYHGQYKRPLLEAEIRALDRMKAELGRIRIPVLFLHGAADPYVPYEASLDAVERMASEDKTIEVYPGARHELVHEQNREEVVTDLRNWARRIVGAA
ncbi:MAG: alpha/beta hydrolase [Candidatus Eisenbacteria bacterium]